MGKHVGIVEVRIPSDLRSDEVGLHKVFRLTAEFHLCHDESVVVTMKLIHLEGMVSALDQIAVLVDDAALAELHEMSSLVERLSLIHI